MELRHGIHRRFIPSRLNHRHQAVQTVSGLRLLKLVDGRLSIDSQPNCGTTIHARVPLSVRSNSMRAAV
jgi:hypothetical protein